MVQTIGIIGFGSIGQKHLQTARHIAPMASIVVLSQHAQDSEISKVNAIKAESISALIDAKPGIVMVSSEAPKHDLYLDQILDLDAFVMIEKPVAASSEQAKQILNRSETLQNTTVVAYNLRFSRALNVVKTALTDGMIGTIHTANVVVGQNLSFWRPDRNIRETVSSSRDKGGGVLRELSHEFDYLSYLFGRPHAVVGMTGTQHFTAFDVEDTALAVLRYGSSTAPILVALTMDFTRQNTTRTCEIVGSDRTIKWNLLTGTVTLHGGHYERDVLFEDNDDLAQTRAKMWSDAMSKDASVFCDLKTAHHHLQVIETLERSQRDLETFGEIK